jgi:hypothetical protein
MSAMVQHKSEWFCGQVPTMASTKLRPKVVLMVIENPAGSAQGSPVTSGYDLG